MEKEFSFIRPEFDEIFSQEQEKDFSRVFYFYEGITLEEASGKITGRLNNEANEEFLCFEDGTRVRADRIITINGIPGPAWDEYEGYGLACLNCSGGME